jgi:signal transduction histidine kinase/ActR/RegA family two-component response regulator
MTTSRGGIRSLAHGLAEDWCVRAWFLLAAAFVVTYAVVPADHLAWLDLAAYPVFVAGPLVACLAGLGAMAGAAERRLWGVLAAGFGLWLLAAIAGTFVIPSALGMNIRVAADAIYLLHFVPFIGALVTLGSPAASAERGSLARWIRPAFFAASAIGWVTYAVLLPASLATSTLNSRWLAFMVLDLVVLVSLGILARQSRTRRGLVILSSLFGAFLLVAGARAVDALLARAQVPSPHGSGATFLWNLPFLALVLAIRLRHILPETATETTPAPLAPRASPATLVLVLTAFSLPVVHTAAMVFGLVDPLIRPAQDVTVASSTLFFFILGAALYHVTEIDRSRLARERRDLERALLQTQRMEAIGRLSGGIAHDFNNLLTAIGGYADMVAESLPDADGTARAMRHVRAGVEQATGLTRQLLVFSRRQVLHAETVDVNDVLRDVPARHRHLLGGRIDVQLVLSDDAPMAWVDPVQFEQVVLNLLVNSRDAMPDGGVIRISTDDVIHGDGRAGGWPDSKPGRYLRLRVADTGIGIPADVLPQIFEPFFTTKEPGRGTGLGLAQVYGIVGQTGGRVAVESTVGRGTTFSIDLPASDASPLVAPSLLGLEPRGTETVLLAEDEQAVRELVRSMLTTGGYSVLVAGSGEEALAVAGRHPGHIDLLLTDVVMPGINGRVLAERLTRLRPDVAVLFMTGYTDDTVVRHGVLDGAVTLLPKPFTRRNLLDAVRQVLDGTATLGRLTRGQA